MKYYIVRQRSTGYYGQISISSNEGAEFANANTFTLEFSSEPDVMWTPKNKPNIDAMKNTPWYNSDEANPELSKNIKESDIEIIEFEIIK